MHCTWVSMIMMICCWLLWLSDDGWLCMMLRRSKSGERPKRKATHAPLVPFVAAGPRHHEEERSPAPRPPRSLSPSCSHHLSEDEDHGWGRRAGSAPPAPAQAHRERPQRSGQVDFTCARATRQPQGWAAENQRREKNFFFLILEQTRWNRKLLF